MKIDNLNDNWKMKLLVYIRKGFGKDYGDEKNWNMYESTHGVGGIALPDITEEDFVEFLNCIDWIGGGDYRVADWAMESGDKDRD